MKLIIPTLAALAFVAACGQDAPETEVVETPAVEGESELAVVEADATETETADAAALCVDMGPQTPRDISNTAGLNADSFEMAPDYTSMNLCNIHTHTNAEHKGPGFSVFVNDSDYGGYACNDTGSLTEAELTPVEGDFGKVKPGDTIEVHWVHTSCDIEPGEGLGSCLSDTCTDPLLRVEAQVFLVVNDEDALDFTEMAEVTQSGNDVYQAAMIPSDTGTPIVFRGSTTGPSYDQQHLLAAQGDLERPASVR